MTQSHNTDERRLSRRAFVTTTAATAAAATIPSGVAAQSGTDELSTTEQFTAAIMAIQGEVDSFRERNFGDRSDAETAATNAADEFNANSDEWVEYINEHASLDGTIQVVSLEFVPKPEEEPDDTATRYLVADHDGDKYTSAEIVTETDREIDEEVRLESIAAENAAEEIETAYEKFVEPGEPPSASHLSYLGGKYRFGTAHITTTILGDEMEDAA